MSSYRADNFSREEEAPRQVTGYVDSPEEKRLSLRLPAGRTVSPPPLPSPGGASSLEESRDAATAAAMAVTARGLRSAAAFQFMIY